MRTFPAGWPFLTTTSTNVQVVDDVVNNCYDACMARPRGFDEMQVLQAARDEFWSCGYAATSIDGVAAVTGLGKGSLYGAFGDKHALFLRVFDDYCTDTLH